jgi:hypothetical protein
MFRRKAKASSSADYGFDPYKGDPYDSASEEMDDGVELKSASRVKQRKKKVSVSKASAELIALLIHIGMV